MTASLSGPVTALLLASVRAGASTRIRVTCTADAPRVPRTRRRAFPSVSGSLLENVSFTRPCFVSSQYQYSALRSRKTSPCLTRSVPSSVIRSDLAEAAAGHNPRTSVDTPRAKSELLPSDPMIVEEWKEKAASLAESSCTRQLCTRTVGELNGGVRDSSTARWPRGDTPPHV